MKTTFLCMAALAAALFGCTKKDSSDSNEQLTDTTVTKNTSGMKNIISIVEIPTSDFSRAVKFYQTVLGIQIEKTEMAGITMGLFPNSGDDIFVQLIHGSDYKPSASGTMVYLNGGDDLQNVADKIEANGGKIVVPKTEIGPDMGFFAVFTDTEGNKLGLYSTR